jgi:hypothetical protein
MNSAQDADDSQGQENPEEEEIENALGELQYHGMNPEEMDQNPVKDMTGNMFEDLIRKKKMGMIK